MATNFLFKSEGTVLMRVRIGKRVDGVIRELVNIKKVITNLFIPETDWNRYHALQSQTARDKYLERNSKFGKSIGMLDDIRKAVDLCGLDIDRNKLDDIVNDILFAKEKKEQEAKKAAAELKKAEREEAKRKKEQMTFISIHQQKTGRYVEIPCNAKIRAILDKYPEGLPHLSDQKINLYIKEIGKKAKIDELIEIKETRGGEVTKRYYKKYDLICTHTARRTGATLMYLDGIPIYDIMKVTGHKSVTTLEKYIRADKLEVAQKLVLQYDYFK